MYSKAKCQALLDKVAPKYLKALKLDHLNIHFHIIHSVDVPWVSAEAMFQERRPRRIDINVFYDACKGAKDFKLSVIHELLHVKMRHINSLVHKLSRKKSNPTYDRLEEQVVRDIELFIYTLLK